MFIMKASRQQDKEVHFEGLKDGGKHLLCCSACKKRLAIVWVTRPDEDFQCTFAQIDCPYCGDKSYEKLIKGGYHIGHTEDCSVDEIDYDDDKIFLKVNKGGIVSG